MFVIRREGKKRAMEKELSNADSFRRPNAVRFNRQQFSFTDPFMCLCAALFLLSCALVSIFCMRFQCFRAFFFVNEIKGMQQIH